MTYALSSQQCSWAEVHRFVMPKLRKVGDWPMLGSPIWCDLADRDLVRWAAVLDGGQHWALRIEYFQQARREAAQAISAEYDWSGIAAQAKNRAEFFAARPWMRRCSS